MATIRAYTTIGQSRKLAEILPLESADMHYNNVSVRGVNYVDDYRAELMDYNTATKVLSKYSINPLFGVVPCWSLAALLKTLNFPSLTQNKEDEWEVCVIDKNNDGYIEMTASNPIDACVEMIIKLHELKML